MVRAKTKTNRGPDSSPQRNGARSRGPLTEESRARSARNSLKHGLTANTIVLPGENRERFQLLLDDLLADLSPQTTLEFTAVEEIAAGLWRQRRSWAVENSYFDENSSPNDTIGRYKATWKSSTNPASTSTTCSSSKPASTSTSTALTVASGSGKSPRRGPASPAK